MKKYEVLKHKSPLEWGLNIHKAEGEPKDADYRRGYQQGYETAIDNVIRYGLSATDDAKKAIYNWRFKGSRKLRDEAVPAPCLIDKDTN